MNLLVLADLALQFGRVHRVTFHPDGLRPETDTDHTVMLAILACELGQVYNATVPASHRMHRLNLGLLAQLAIVHDLIEAEAGDTNTFAGLTADDQREKEAREARALASLRARLGDGWTVQAIDAYEWQDDPEARFVRYLDKITPKLTQALNGSMQSRKAGRDVAWLHARHRKQGAELAERYPEWAPVLGPIFDAACEAAERALAEATGADDVR